MCSYENVRIETADLLLKKAMQDDWKDMYENLWQHKESAKYMLWNVTTSEADAFSRMERTVEFEKKEKYALTEFRACCRRANLASHNLQMSCGFTFSHEEDKIDPRDDTAYVMECNVKYHE